MSASLNRRDFIRAAAGGGAVVATSALPAFGGDGTADFSRRGWSQRLSLAYGRIKAGAEKPFSLLHISDTHLTAAYDDEEPKYVRLRNSQTPSFGGMQEEALRDSLAWAKKNADLVVHTGDIMDWQSRANFDLVRKYFGAEIFGAIGNHDYFYSTWEVPYTENEAYKRDTAEKLRKIYPFDISFAAKVFNGVNFISIDNAYGTVTPEIVERFHDEVKKGLPIILAQHVPVYTPFIKLANRKYWSNGRRLDLGFARETLTSVDNQQHKNQLEDKTTADFIAYLKTEPLLKGILAGHVHFTVQERFSPTATQFVVGGNYLFQGEEIVVA